MSEIIRKYDLLLMNNASRQFHLFRGLPDESTSHLYHKFNVNLNECNDGEHTYAVVYNERDDVEYEFKTPILDTVLHYGDDESIVLRLLQPDTGLLRIGTTIEPENTYIPDENNDTTFYYNG